jgi:hypothetical protein
MDGKIDTEMDEDGWKDRHGEYISTDGSRSCVCVSATLEGGHVIKTSC